MAEDLRKLYDGVSSQLDVGDYNTFVQKMQTPQDRKRFYDAVTSNGFDLGDYNSYEQRLSSVKKKEDTTPLQKSSGQGGSPSPSVSPSNVKQGIGIDIPAIVKKSITPQVNKDNKPLKGIGKPFGFTVLNNNKNYLKIPTGKSAEETQQALQADQLGEQLAVYLTQNGKDLTDFDPIDFKRQLKIKEGVYDRPHLIGEQMAKYKSDEDAFNKVGSILQRNIDLTQQQIDDKFGKGTFDKYQQQVQAFNTQYSQVEPQITAIDSQLQALQSKKPRTVQEMQDLKAQYSALAKQRDGLVVGLQQQQQGLQQYSEQPEFKKLAYLQTAQQNAAQKQQALLDKYPDVKSTFESREKMQKWIDGLSKSVDAMPNGAGNSLGVALFGDAINSAVGLAHKLASIPEIVEKALGVENSVLLTPFNFSTGLIKDATEQAYDYTKTLIPSKYELPVAQKFKMVNGNKVFLDKNNKPTFVRDSDGYKIDPKDEQQTLEAYNKMPDKTKVPIQETTNVDVLINEAAKFGIDIVYMGQIGRGLSAVGLAGTPAKTFANGTLTLMGFGLNDAYENAKLSAPNLTDQQAAQYALGSQAAIGSVFSLLGGAKMQYITGEGGESIFSRVRNLLQKDGALKLDANDIKAIDGGASAFEIGKKRMQKALGEALLQSGEMGIVMPTLTAFANKATNALAGYKAMDDNIEISKENLKNSALPAFLVGLVTGGMSVSENSMKQEAWSKINKNEGTVNSTLEFLDKSVEDGIYTPEQAQKIKDRIEYTQNNLKPLNAIVKGKERDVLSNLYDAKYQLQQKADEFTDSGAKKAYTDKIRAIDNDIAQVINGKKDFQSNIALGILDGVNEFSEKNKPRESVFDSFGSENAPKTEEVVAEKVIPTPPQDAAVDVPATDMSAEQLNEVFETRIAQPAQEEVNPIRERLLKKTRNEAEIAPNEPIEQGGEQNVGQGLQGELQDNTGVQQDGGIGQVSGQEVPTEKVEEKVDDDTKWSSARYPRIVEPKTSLNEMDSEAIYNLAVQNKKALQELDKKFSGKTEAEKEEGGFYNFADDVSDLRDLSERMNFIENAEDINSLSISLKSILSEIKSNTPNEYQEALLSAVKRRLSELNGDVNDLIKETSKKIANQYKDIEDATLVVSEALKTLLNVPPTIKNNQLKQKNEPFTYKEQSKISEQDTQSGIKSTDNTNVIPEQVQSEPVSKMETTETPALKDVESTAKALDVVDTQSLKEKLGIEANWDMIGEGDALSGKDPVLAYTQKQLPEWNLESQLGNIDPNSKITYDIARGETLAKGTKFETKTEDKTDVALAKDENGITVGVVKLDNNGGIEHIAVAPEFRGKGVADNLIKVLKENNPNLDLSKTKLRSKGFEKAFGNKIISEAYHKAKADGSNPELVKAVEELLNDKGTTTESNQSVQQTTPTAKEQGVAEAVQQGADAVGQGNAEGKSAILDEIKSKNLTHVRGKNMGENQALGTFVSTEKGNRYETKDKKAESVEVDIQNPFVVDNGDFGLVDKRQEILNANRDKFDEYDTVDYQKLPDGKLTVDNLNEKGIKKLAELTTNELKARGYDGIYFRESGTQEGELVVFDKGNVRFNGDNSGKKTKLVGQSKSDGNTKSTSKTKEADTTTESGSRKTIESNQGEGQQETGGNAERVITKVKGTPKAKRTVKNPEYKKALSHEPESAEDMVLQAFIGGAKIVPDVIKKLYRNASGELKNRIGLLSRDGYKSISEMAHHLWENQESVFGYEKFDSQELENAIEDVLNSYTGTRLMVDELNKKYGADVDARSAEEYAKYIEFEADATPEQVSEMADYLESLSPQELERMAYEKDQAFIDDYVTYAENPNRRKALSEYNAETDRLKDAVDKAKSDLASKTKQLDAQNQIEMFGGVARADQLFAQEKDISKENRDAILKPLNDKVAKAESDLQKHLDNKEQYISKYDNQARIDEELSGKELAADALDRIASKLGSKKNLTEEERTSLAKDVTDLAKGLIQMGKATLDNVIDKIKDEIRKRLPDIDDKTLNEVAKNVENKVLFSEAVNWYKDKGYTYEKAKADLDKADVDYKESDLRDLWNEDVKIETVEPQSETVSNDSLIKEGLVDDSKFKKAETKQQTGGEEVKKRVLTERAYEGTFRDDVKAEIEKLGLTRQRLSYAEAEGIAKKFIEDFGIDTAYEAVRKGDIDGAPAAEIYNAKIEQIEEQLLTETDPERMAELFKQQAEIISDFGEQALKSGQFNSQLNNIYEKSDLGYNVEKKIDDFKKENGGEIPAEVEKKFRELDAEYQDVKKKLAEAEQRAKEAEEKLAFDNIVESVAREKKTKSRSKRADDLIAEGIDELASILGVKLSAEGTRRPELTKALAKIGSGLIDKSIATAENVFEKIQEYVKAKFGDKVDIEEYRDDILSAINTKDIKPIYEDGKLTVPRRLIRDIVESGVGNIDDLTKAVQAKLKEQGVDLTEREVRDAITGYGKTVNPTRDEVEAQINKMKRLGRLISGLEDVSENKRPLKTGLQRERMDAEERAKKKELREAMKDLPMDEATLESELKTQLDAEKSRLRNRIEDLQREIDKNELTPRNARTVREDAELKKLREDLEKVKAEHDAKFKNDDYKEKRRLELAKRLTNRRIEDLQRRLREGDFSKNTRKPLIADSELTKLKAEKLRIQEEYDKEFYKNKLANRTKEEKVKDALLEAWGLTRALRATGEFSFVGVQGLVNSIAHPMQALQAMKRALQFMKSEAKTEQWLREVKSQDYYPILKQSKLSLTEPHAEMSAREELFVSDWFGYLWNTIGTPIKFANEKAFEAWKSSNPLKALERASVGYLDTIRVMRFLDGMEMLKEKGFTPEKNAQEYKDMADVINTLTGRASLGRLEQNADMLAKVFFSPRNWASMLKQTILLPRQLYKWRNKTDVQGMSVANKMALADLSKFVGLTTSVVMMFAAALNDDKDENTGVELDPRSTNFGKIKIKNKIVDPWGGRIQQVIFASRLFMDAASYADKDLSKGGYKNSEGEITQLGVPFKSPSGTDLVLSQAINKLSPSAALMQNFLSKEPQKDGTYKTQYGDVYSLSGDLKESMMPIYWGTVHDLYKDDPSLLNGLLAFYAFFGGGVNVYDKKKATKK